MRCPGYCLKILPNAPRRIGSSFCGIGQDILKIGFTDWSYIWTLLRIETMLFSVSLLVCFGFSRKQQIMFEQYYHVST